VALVPSLDFAGRAACATEWWVRAGLDAGASRACLEACCGTLAHWGQAHGIRHALLAPGLAAGHGGAPPGFSRHGSGMWHRSLVPAAKLLG
jgi:NAD(P)-dependent dehydrogenase (short-subunit alcohol dehydrogenase family)